MARKSKRSAESLVPLKIVFELVDNLRLDSLNPRFAASAQDETQDSLVRVLWNDFAVDELALSIAANGYFQEEPLLVIPDDASPAADTYIVVEGNRRLAAVLLLRDADLRRRVKASSIPTIGEPARTNLDSLPVSKYSNREEIWRYLGFRHINGPQPWDSFSKAMYVAQVHDDHGVSLDAIANTIGDRHATVKRLYRGYKVLQQAEAMTTFRRDDRFPTRFFFSHLYTALDYPEFQSLLGIGPEQSLGPSPVPKSRLPQLRELMVWFYGSKADNREPIVKKQDPDLNTLREVISQPRGLEALHAGYPLQRSYDISIGDERRFRNALVRAKDELQIADGTLATGYSGEEESCQLFQDITTIVDGMRDRMETKRVKRPGRASRG